MSRERSYPCSNPASHAICTKRAYLHKWKCMENSCTYIQKSLADSTSSLLLNSSPNLSNLVKRMSQATTRLAPNTTGSHHKTSWDRQRLRQGQGRRSRCACQSSCTHRKRNIPVKACEASESKAPLSATRPQKIIPTYPDKIHKRIDKAPQDPTGWNSTPSLRATALGLALCQAILRNGRVCQRRGTRWSRMEKEDSEGT